MSMNSLKNNASRYIALFLTISACIVFYFFVERFQGFADYVAKIVQIIRPFIFGGVIAYLLIPVSVFIDRWLCRLFRLSRREIRAKKQRTRRRKLIAASSILLSILLFLSAIYGLIALVIPELAVSIRSLAASLPVHLQNIRNWIDQTLSDSPQIQRLADTYSDQINGRIQNFLSASMPEMNSFLSGLSASVLTILATLKDLLIGVMIAIYIMNDRAKFVHQAKMLILAIFPYRFDENARQEQLGDWIIRQAGILHVYTGGFIKGKLLDSLIIGLICFVFTYITRMPYFLLVSVIVGVTNIIPFFGPFIGAIPSALLILMMDPIKCLVFIVFVIILQQVDGNIIGPAILGNATNLDSFWVLFAILFFGGLWGVPGMIIGVPLFGFIYQLISEIVHKRLKKQQEKLREMYMNDQQDEDVSGSELMNLHLPDEAPVKPPVPRDEEEDLPEESAEEDGNENEKD